MTGLEVGPVEDGGLVVGVGAEGLVDLVSDVEGLVFAVEGFKDRDAIAAIGGGPELLSFALGVVDGVSMSNDLVNKN